VYKDMSISIKATAITHLGSSSHSKVISLASTSLFKSNSEPLLHVSLYNYKNTPVMDILLLPLTAHRLHRNMSYWRNIVHVLRVNKNDR